TVGPEGGVEAPCGNEIAPDIPLKNDIPAEVAQGSLKDVEDEIGSEMDTTVVSIAEGCGAGVNALLLAGFVKILKDLRGGPEKGHLSSVVEKKRLVEHVKESAAGLVDGDEGDLVMGESTYCLEDVLGVLGGEP